MSNKTDAVAALFYARDKTSTYKSSNKYFGEDSPLKTKRRYESSVYQVALYKQSPQRGATMEEITHYGRRVIAEAHGAGNCGEMAAIACDYLSKQDIVPAFDYVILESPGDHAFVVVGEPAPIDGIYPLDFADWAHDAYICDPWANLVCRANKYPAKWLLKMTKWDRANKRLGKPGTEYQGQLSYVSPTDPYWSEAPRIHNKLSLTYQAPTMIPMTGGNGAKKGCCGCTLL